MANLRFVDKPAAAKGSRTEIPEEMANDLEMALKYLIENPGKEGYAEEADDTALNRWFRHARLYFSRREGEPAYTIRRLPSEHLPEGHARFTITPVKPAEPTPAG